MACARLFVPVAVMLAGCSSSTTKAGSTTSELDRSEVVARARATLQRPGKVVKIVGTTMDNYSWAVYVAVNGVVVSNVTGRSAVSSLDDASSLPYLSVLSKMDRFRARLDSVGSQPTDVVAMGRYHFGDSSGCRTNETIVLDPSYLPIRWTSKACHGEVVSMTFTFDVVDAARVPADVSSALTSTA